MAPIANISRPIREPDSPRAGLTPGQAAAFLCWIIGLAAAMLLALWLLRRKDNEPLTEGEDAAEPNGEFDTELQDWDGSGLPEGYISPVHRWGNQPANPQNRGPQTTYYNPAYTGFNPETDLLYLVFMYNRPPTPPRAAQPTNIAAATTDLETDSQGRRDQGEEGLEVVGPVGRPRRHSLPW